MDNILQFPQYRYFAECPMCKNNTWRMEVSKREENEKMAILMVECSKCSAELDLENMKL